MKKILFLLTFAAGLSATAQVKVGTNPTVLATNANFQVEGTTTADQFVVLKNGNVGIGTTAPGAKLAVNGGIIVGNGNTNNGALSASDGLIFGDSGSGEGISSKRTAGGNQYGLDFYTDRTNKMTIRFNGNVGIGTTAPTQKLEVQGGALISSLAGTGSRMVTASATGVLGTADIPVANSKFTNDAANARVFLTNLSDGVTARPAKKNFFITDAGQLLMGTQSDENARIVINSEEEFPIALVAASKNTDNRSGFGLIGIYQQANYEGTGLANEVVASKAISVAQVGSGTIGNLSSVKAWSVVRNGYTGTIINQLGVDVVIDNNANTGTINNLVGVNIVGLDNPLAAGLNRYGLKIGDVVGSTYQPGGTALAIKTGRGGVSLGDAQLEIGDVDSGDRISYFDMHASNGVDYSSRIHRTPGVNGNFEVLNEGTGDVNLVTKGNINLFNKTVLGTTAGSVSPVATFVGLAGNNSAMDFRTRRHTAGSDWTGTNTRLQKRIDGSDFGFIDFGIDGRSGGDGIGLGFGAVGQTYMVVNSGGNVGIGTTTPTEKLDVTGNIKFSGALMPNNLPGTVGQILTSAGANTAPTWATATAATTPNIYTSNGTIAAATNRNITLGDRLTSKINIAPAGEEPSLSTLNVIGGNLGGGITSGILVSNSYINNTYKNGIIKVPQFLNTNPPVMAFAVESFTDNNVLTIGGNSSGSQASPQTIHFRVDSDADLTNSALAGTKIAMSIMGVTGNVGVGTTTPTAKLDIVNNLLFNPGANDIAAIKVSGSYGGGIVFAEGSKRSSISAPYGDSLSFSTGGTTAAGSTERMVISSNGNVGIGLTGPATSKLQVAGLPIHASNAAALTAGLTAGAFYHAGDGILRVVF